MKALTRAVVGSGGVLTRVDCQPPLTLRQVRSDDPANCALCLVNTAAGPLAGDDLRLELELEPGARASLSAAGANLAQGRGGAAGSLQVTARLGAGAVLYARPGAVVVGAGGQVRLTLCLELAEDAALDWRELIVLGRSSEQPGAATLRWDVTRAARPVLRQQIDLTDPELVAWPGMLAGGRVIGTALRAGPQLSATTRVHTPTAVAAKLDAHTELVTVLGADAATVSSQLDAFDLHADEPKLAKHANVPSNERLSR